MYEAAFYRYTSLPAKNCSRLTEPDINYLHKTVNSMLSVSRFLFATKGPVSSNTYSADASVNSYSIPFPSAIQAVT